MNVHPRSVYCEMTSGSHNTLQRFYLHYPEGHRFYVCIVDGERRPFDFCDNTFKFANELACLGDACLYASGSHEDRADHGYSYRVEFDLARLLAGKSRETVPAEGAIVSIHWLLQVGDEPDVKVDGRHDNCRLRLVSGKFEPVDTVSGDQLDENIAFKKRANAEKEYREFVLREIDDHDLILAGLAAAVRAGDVAGTLRIVAGDLCCWARNLKDHLLHHMTHLAKTPSFVRMLDVPEDASFQFMPTWVVRDWVGTREAFDLLEFHKSPEYARSFSARLDRLHRARVEFAHLVVECMVRHHGEDLDGLVALDEARKDLKHMALVHAEHVDRIAAQFDAARSPVPGQASAAALLARPSPPPAGVQEQAEREAPRPFQGGELVFLADRVELCGVDICSGPRSQTRRRLLELLRIKEANGTFKSYSGEELAIALEPKGGQGTVAGAIRDLRDEIMAALRTKGNLLCGRKDVILSGGSGYRLAESITVADGGHAADEAVDTDDLDAPDARLVLDVPDEPAVSRQAWILDRLAEGVQLNAPDVAKHFQCSVKTAQRALTTLREEGKIEFVGASRTGYYRLRQRPGYRPR